jgi:hypothetical protein
MPVWNAGTAKILLRFTKLPCVHPPPPFRCFGQCCIQSQDLGSGMNILDLTFESLETVFGLTLLKFFNADPGSF